MIHLRRLLVVLSSLLLASISAQAQVSYTGGTYSQNFDSVPNSGTYTFVGAGPIALSAVSTTPPNNAVAGWSFAKTSGSGTNALFAFGTGSSNSGAVYSFGSAGSADRAFGTLFSGTTGSVIGVVFTNNSGFTITQVTVTYTGEEWRYGSTSGTDKLAFEYQVGGSSVAAGTFTAAPALDFSSPIHGNGTTGTAVALDGNAAANRTLITATISGLNWAPGQNLVLRWNDFNVTGSDDGLAIDDFSFTTNAGSGPVPPFVTSTNPADSAVNASPGTSISISFNDATSVTGTWFTINGSASGSHSASVLGGPSTYTLVPSPLFAEGEIVTVNVLASQVKDAITGTATMSANYPFSFTTQSLAPLPIHTIQGNGATSPFVGQTVSVEGIVTALYPSTNPLLGGFYVQAAEANYDSDPTTSEGMFVNTNSFSFNVGDVVKATGTIEERTSSGVTTTRMTSVSFVALEGVGAALPTPVALTLPLAGATAAEPYEGMRVILPQTLTVTDNFDLGHFGEVILSLGRLSTPTNVVAPGAPAIALEATNLLSQILVDDSLDTPYPDPTPALADSAGRGQTRRTGSTTAGVTGVLDNKFGVYLLEAPTWPAFVDANPRGTAPTVSGSLKIAIGNVLNFFNGNGSGLDGSAGGFPTSRGATNLAEYQRQRAKIIAGILGLAPDIMGLTEVENDRVTNGLPDSYGSTSAIADIVNGLNATAPAGTTYAYVNAAAVDIVTDVIHCAFIYRVETVAPVGLPAMLNSAAFNNVARNPQAQTFRQISNNEILTVAINHFRAKGSAASGAGNTDSGDGQGTNNALRVQEANALTAWLATDPTGSGDPDFLIIGDLNAYAKENPITTIESSGYVNLTEAAEGSGGYSYAFNGEFGHLDHALANDHLAGQVVDAATWHVNSDEPIYYDYNTENKSAAQQAINVGTAYRYSDHDPVVVGLNLRPDPAADVTGQLTITRTGLLRNRTTGRYNQTITIKNTSAVPYAGPVTLALDGLSPNATLFGAAGFTTVAAPLGSPYANVNVGPDSTLTPGETVTVLVEFTNPSNQAITYTTRVLAGPGGR